MDASIARPDITLTIDRNGVIQTALSAEGLADEKLEAWRGRPWRDTIEPAINAEAARKLNDAASRGASSYFQVSQRFPSGRELPIEYTTISLGESAGFVAIGKNLETIARLQSRLQFAQQAREQDRWKTSEIETRYRLLFDAATEAVVLVRAANLRIVEANAAANKALGLAPGAEFYPALSARDKTTFEGMLAQVREHGRAPSIVLRFGPANQAWGLRASSMKTETGSYYLFQIAPVGAATPLVADRADPVADDIVQRLPDAFVIVDRDGVVRRANHTFLDLVQVGAEPAVLGQNLKRWLNRPGADAATLLGLLQRHGRVRLLSATLNGELNSATDVEISAVGDRDGNAAYFGMVLRDVTARLRAGRPAEAQASMDQPHDGGPGLSLVEIVKASTAAIERRTIVAALEMAQGNRTRAAKRLGVSRQSLHTKLKLYNVGES